MAVENRLAARPRTEKGTAVCRRIRRAGGLPGGLRTENGENRDLTLDRHAFELLLRHHASESLIVDLDVEGEAPRKVLLKEVQHDPLRGCAVHADFLEISMSRKMRVGIPLELEGDPVGVTQEGGVLEQAIREVEVECLPGDLVESIKVDVSGLRINDSLTVADLRVGAGLTVLTEPEIAVASVQPPRVEEEAEAAAEGAEAEAAQPEVIGKAESQSAEEGSE